MTITERFKAKLQATEGREVEYNGFPLKLRYAPLEIWIAHGRVPQFLASKFLAAQAAIDAGEPQQATLEDANAYLSFKKQVIEFCAIEPRITYGDAPDAIKAEEIDATVPGLLNFVFAFGLRQAEDSAIETANGEVNVNALASFRDNGERAFGIDSASAHGADVLTEAVNVAGAG